MPKFFSDLIGDLRDEVWRLKGIGAPTEDATPLVTAMSEDATARDTMFMSLEDELRKKNAEINAMKRKYISVVFGFIVFVLGLVVGKMVLN